MADWPSAKQMAAIRALERALAACRATGVYLYNASGSIQAFDHAEVQEALRTDPDLTASLRRLSVADRGIPVVTKTSLDAGDY